MNPTRHPIEQAIIEHIVRYSMTTAEASHRAGVRGMTDAAVAESRLRALQRRGELCCLPLTTRMQCFVLSANARTTTGELTASKSQWLDSPRARMERYAFLAFACLGSAIRTKLLHAELRERFADLFRPQTAHHYYVTNEFAVARLGFLRIDSSTHGRWDRIVAKACDDMRRHLSIPLVRTLLDSDAFELTVLTALPAKAERIAEAIGTKREALPIPYRVIAVPELINLIRPAPD